MYDIEEKEYHINTLGNLLDYQQTHLKINIEQNKRNCCATVLGIDLVIESSI